jgi:ribosomal protein S18 acetylase RimI-like enzyme
MGPIDYSTNYVCGLVIEGFEHPPTLLTPHNPPYYQQLMEDCGLTKVIDWFAWWFEDFEKPVARLRRIARGRGQKHTFTIRPIELRDLRGESQRLRAVFNEAWKSNWGFVPMSDAEADDMAREMKPIIDPQFTYIAEAEGQPVGFLICVRDINVALKEIDGRLLPFGWARVLFRRSRIRKMRVVALGVVDAFRRVGVAEALVLKLMEEGTKLGLYGELSMTLETNHLVNRLIEAMGARLYKRYRIYRQTLAT